MFTVACASGKGGTGKTTVATNLAATAAKNHNTTLLDCDVEAANGHLFFQLQNVEECPVQVPVPRVEDDLCSLCGQCADHCRFNAISLLGDTVLVFEELCHSCGVCSYVCPEEAIGEEDRGIGIVRQAEAGDLRFVGGELNTSEPLAPPVIEEVCKKTAETELVIIDAAPGSSCPTVEAVKDTDLCLLVTEPTPFGLSDLKMAVGMCRRLQIPTAVVINRCDTGDDRVENYCRREQLPIIARLPWDRQLALVHSRGKLIVQHSTVWRQRMEDLLQKTLQRGRKGAAS